MNLADKLISGSSGSFPLFPSANGFFSNLDDFADLHFSNFKAVNVFNGLGIYAGSPEEDDITTDEYVKELDGIHFRDNNSNNQYDSTTDVKLASVKVFITHDGAFLLKKYNALKDQIKEDEVALFLEYSGSDIISDAVTLVLAGSKAKNHVSNILKSNFIQDRYWISPEKQEKLVETVIASNSLADAALSIFIELQDAIITKVTEIGVAFFGEIESFFSETLRIPDRFWNVEAEGSIMGGLGNLIEAQLGGVSKEIDAFINKYDYLLPDQVQITLLGIGVLADYALAIFKGARLVGEFFIALVCGIWNAIMDTIAGIFGLVKLVIQGISGVAKMANGAINYASHADYYNSLVMEYLDNMLAEAIKIDWKEVIEEAKKEMFEIATLMIRLPVLIWDKITELNHTEVGYYVGYLLFEIVSFIFPPIKIAELGKLAKWTRFSKIREVSKVVPEGAASKAVNKADEFFEFIQPLIKKLKAGTKEFKDFVRNILRNFRAWIEGLFTNIMKTSDEVTELFRRGKTTTAKGEVRFRRPELANFASKLEKKYSHLNLKVNIVTPNSTANKLRLKRWDRENVLGSFAPGPPPVIHVRQRCTYLTMQHEIWHLEDYNRLGITEYKKVLNWKHEESVWLKILHNKDQWTQGELLDSYKYYKKTAFDEGATPILEDELEKLLK